MPAPLCRAELLAFEGSDAVAFAQAQFSSDVAALAPGRWQWSAWLDAQGRARAVFALLRPDAGRLLAWQPLGDAAAMRNALARYVFRSAVRLEAVEGWALHRLDGASIAPGTLEERNGGYALALPGAAPRLAWLAPAAGATDAAALSDWRRGDLTARLPLLAAELAGEFVPQALELDRIDAIRFDKGCYPGQEVAARLHFRGGNKRRLQLYRVDGVAPASATPVRVGETAVGRILYAVDDAAPCASHALAVVTDEAREAVAATPDGRSLSPCT